MKNMAVLVAVLGAGLLAVATADAALPTFKSDLIVPNKSLAGIRLNGSYAAAVKDFRSGACSKERGCNFEGANRSTFGVFFAEKTSTAPWVVGAIKISAGFKLVHGKVMPVFAAPLTALKTASGIGLGSTPREVKAAYPKVTGSAASGYVLQGRRQMDTSFEFQSGRLAQITLGAGKYG